MPDLGLIIVDEEQETSFKQEEQPRYHAREVARQRARIESAVLLLGSATPSLETYFKAEQGKMRLLELRERVGQAYIPRVTIEDMRRAFPNQARKLVSPLLEEKIQENLERQEQIILFINRRGYSPMTVCWECGHITHCPVCSVAMTYHRDIERNVCHYCNRQERMPVQCAACGSLHLQLLGAGTQKVEEEIKSLFSQASIARLDMDSSRRSGVQQSILQRMRNREIDILIGTQMVAKGLDFPNVSLVGIIDADSILNIPDFRAGERCFQLLVQAAGRAGRSGLAGEVVIQTYNPDHLVINFAAQQDYRDFYNHEIKTRQLLDYPPLTHLLRIVMSSEGQAETDDYANRLAAYIEEITDAKEEEITILGPAPCPIARIRNRFRVQILVKCISMELLRSMAVHILARAGSKHVKMEWDIDPVTTI
jgi:primosomal protein N' (replication factor Y)